MRSAILYAIVGAMATLASASDFAEMGMEMHLAGDLGIVPRATATNLQVLSPFPLWSPPTSPPLLLDSLDTSPNPPTAG